MLKAREFVKYSSNSESLGIGSAMKTFARADPLDPPSWNLPHFAGFEARLDVCFKISRMRDQEAYAMQANAVITQPDLRGKAQ
jgi:hypothetical protein